MALFSMVFSPTGGVQAAADALLSGMAMGPVRAVDLTEAAADFSAVKLTPQDIALVAVPAFGGRVPEVAARRLTQISGGGARAVLLAVYGNRAFEDTLAELQDVLEMAGFVPVAAVTAVAEHSIARCYAAGRPDQQDRQQLESFAGRIAQALRQPASAPLRVPGNRPDRAYHGGYMPLVVSDACTRCGLCAARCPVQAIDRTDPNLVDERACFACMRCVAICPQGARTLAPAALEACVQKLAPLCRERKENQLFL